MNSLRRYVWPNLLLVTASVCFILSGCGIQTPALLLLPRCKHTAGKNKTVEVVFLADNDGIAGGVSKGQVKAVRPGYARNFLCRGREKVAVYATEANRQLYESRPEEELSVEQKQGLSSEKKIVKKLESKKLEIKRQEGNEWEVTRDNISEKLSKHFHITVDPKHILLPNPIRGKYGDYELDVQLAGGGRASLRMNVVKR